ncbi:MAG: iron ABC transporter substrate-binding protein [Thermomicrobiales bacterium]|nr:iron ABC transporter substrate-binding protein [Thermomicrobiales bacterium]
MNRRSVVLGGGATAIAALAFGGRAFAKTDVPETSATPAAGGTPVGSAGEVVIYSGRNEGLIGALIEQFQNATGIKAEVRYGDTAELAATILEEGDNSPADVFFSQDAGALGALAGENRLEALPDAVLARVPEPYRSPDGVWVGASARARVAAYNTEMLTEADLPASVLDLTNETWKGKVGWAPTNASFQAFVTAFRVLKGDDAAREWLQGMLDNEAIAFDGNGALVRAVGAGELPIGLVNHYYLYEIQAEEGALPIANHFFAAGDPGSLVNVAGAGILTTAAHPEQAQVFVDYLLQTAAQTYFAEQTAEYPLIEGVPTVEGLIPLAEVGHPDIDLSDLADLQGTLELLAEVGVV